MKHPHEHEKYQKLLHKFGFLLKNILMSHDHDHLADIVMHELCNRSGLNIGRAAYFVDNPDFNCLQGVAGFCQEEVGSHVCDWNNKHAFVECIKDSKFNQKVKQIKRKSVKHSDAIDTALMKDISQELEIPNPGYYAWDMKHDNHGIFVYQKKDVADEDINHLQDAVCLLGFCPLF